jgi:hypothetical protein
MWYFVYFICFLCATAEPVRQLQQWCATDVECAASFKTRANDSAAFEYSLRILLNASATDVLSSVFERHYAIKTAELTSDSLRLHWLILMKSVSHPFELLALKNGAQCSENSQMHYDQRSRVVRCVADLPESEEHWHTPLLSKIAIYSLAAVVFLSTVIRIFYYTRKIKKL